MKCKQVFKFIDIYEKKWVRDDILGFRKFGPLHLAFNSVLRNIATRFL